MADGECLAGRILRAKAPFPDIDQAAPGQADVPEDDRGGDAMKLIVDGYNLIRKVPSLSEIEAINLEAGRRRLLEYLGAYRRRTGHGILVIFDGNSGRDCYNRIEVRYHNPADDLIVSLSGPDTLVITSDREVADRAGARGAMTCTSEEFRDYLLPCSRSDPYLEEEDDDYPNQRVKKGNPRRLSRKAREEKGRRQRVQRVLRGR